MKAAEATALTPALQLRTLYAFNAESCITSTLEPNPSRGPKFSLIRSSASCAWAVHAGLPTDLATELNRLAAGEPPVTDLRTDPRHADRYLALAGGRVDAGPAFAFPDDLAQVDNVVVVTDVAVLARNFRGWTQDEIPERSPIFAVVEEGSAVSVCFCARRTAAAAEAGVETGASFRGRLLAPRVTTAWAQAIRSSGRIPIYSTSWSNHASLSVARKLKLVACACDWSVT